MFRDALLIARKDLRIEWRSKVATTQVLPFALLVLLLFAFALDPDRGVLKQATPGLYWVAILFTAVIAVQRAFAIEVADGNLDALRLSGLDPAGLFLGKVAALSIQMLALEVVLVAGVVVLYDAVVDWSRLPLAIAICLAATVGMAAAGTLYGALSAGIRGRESLLPLLLLPVLAPVLIGATRGFESALDLGLANQRDLAEGWQWTGLLTVFALVYLAIGLVAFGPLLEEA
ncbi:MAG: heme exporter protein CcmB [Acidimicrobiia bacterium]